MIKKLFLVLITSFLPSISLLAQQQVTVDMDLPAQVEAGKSFNVTVTVEKSSLEEFSRFQQELPAGLTAKSVNSGTADFSFENQRIRFIWLKLPSDEKITISYMVNVHERLMGSFSLEGEFSYVEDNQRKSVKVSSESITIIPSPSVEESMLVDIASFAEVLSAEKAAGETGYDIACIRQTPYLSKTGDEILVNLLVYKKELDKFAKIEEQIPDGFKALNVDSKEGIFTFNDGLAKFVWMNLPAGSGFLVSYRLIPAANKTLDNLNLKGQFSYIKEGRNVIVDIIQRNVDLSSVNADNVDEVMAAISSGQTILPATQEGTTAEKITITDRETEKPPEREVQSLQDVDEAVGSKQKSIPANLLLPVEDGIYYRVQLVASHRLVNVSQVFGHYNLDRSVKVEYHEGWYKYTVGSFKTYVSAQNYKNRMIREKSVGDAFITAYRNGIRIDVIDALQLTGEAK